MAIDESYVADAPSAVEAQVREYERGERRAFDLRAVYPDTFTGEVMRAIAAMPYGEVRTYGELAGELDTSPVAVGGACGRNPVPVVVPCHRVVGAAAKRRLLDAEARTKGESGRRVPGVGRLGRIGHTADATPDAPRDATVADENPSGPVRPVDPDCPFPRSTCR